ncbi:hypothetical protein ACET3Z_001230 [Daucus carota]
MVCGPKACRGDSPTEPEAQGPITSPQEKAYKGKSEPVGPIPSRGWCCLQVPRCVLDEDEYLLLQEEEVELEEGHGEANEAEGEASAATEPAEENPEAGGDLHDID